MSALDRRKKRIVIALATICFGLTACVIVGCGGQSDELVSVSGKVTIKGALIKHGAVVFTPDPKHGGRGAVAAGAILQDGTYRLKTGDKVGARPGWYRITLAAYNDRTTPIPGQKFSLPNSLLPDRLRDPDTSDLVREVKNGKKNVIHFQLD